ncbi:MAG TPA: biotin--[acetyl-CoA-carboxylase] ligase [Nitrospirota bacterium]|nr:biotin--[acetyl-CoA-carboxylase] ligase [Nitrospirota bacterium]
MYKDKILKYLRLSKAGFASGEELAMKLGISRTMVWRHIKALEREGFEIEAVPSRGYRVTSEPDILRKGDIGQGLKTRMIGKSIHLFREVESTNTLAMEMASRGALEGTVVIAETQTGGKGRVGRKWISPKGNLYLSVILRPEMPLNKAPMITLMGAVATATAIRKQCGVHAVIKWPNDILIAGRKASGLLTEMSAEQDRIRHIVLGIGIDVNMNIDELPPEVRQIATTLEAECGRKIDRQSLLRQLMRELDAWYQVFLAAEKGVLAEWKVLNVTIGNSVAVSGTGETFQGIAKDIDNEGRLIVEISDGTMRTVAAGDVSLLKK